jgi:type IV pilus assembly protein PilM
MMPLPPEAVVDGAIMNAGAVVEAIRNLLRMEKIKTKEVATAISGQSVIVKKIRVPQMTEKELAENIQWEAEQHIPFEISDVNIDFQILPSTGHSEEGEGNQINVLLVAAKKAKVDDYTRLIIESGLNPVVVDTDVFAIENEFENNNIIEDKVVSLIDIGAATMNINILKGGVFSFTRDISIGGKQYNEAIQRELDLSFDQAERAKRLEEVEGVDPNQVNDIVQRLNSEMVSEVVRSFDYFKTTSPNETINQILLSGGSARLPEMTTLLTERSGIPVELFNPFNRIEVPPDLFDADFIAQMAPQAAVGVGLALRRMGDRWSE